MNDISDFMLQLITAEMEVKEATNGGHSGWCYIYAQSRWQFAANAALQTHLSEKLSSSFANVSKFSLEHSETMAGLLKDLHNAQNERID